VKEKRKVLEEKTKFLNDFKISNNALNYEAQSTTKMSQIMEYDLRKEQLLSDIQRVKISLSSINKKLNETSAGGPNDQAAINSNIVKIREKIDELSKEYERTGSTNQELSNSIKDLRYQLQVEISKLSVAASPTRNLRQDLLDQKDKYELELQIANANLENVSRMIGTLQGTVSGYATKEAAILELQNEVDKAKEEYGQALDRFNTEQSKSLIAGSTVRIITKAQPNGHAEFSKRYLIVALSGVASFILCAFVIIFMEYLDVRIKTPHQFSNFVNINLSGSVNSINTKDLNLGDLFANKKDNQMEVFKHFLRKLRFEVESSKSKVILITSTKNGEGKTFIIMCIAYLLSLLQKRILIIDTNFKNNSLTQQLLKKHQNTKKLEHGIFIKGQIGEGGNQREQTEEDITNSIIYPTGHKGINIIGNNGGNESPSEIFAGRDFGDMIRKLSETYDYILLEGASLNNYSDTKELVDYSDKVLAVFSAESILKQIDRDSINYLSSLNGKLMGAVLNKVDTKDLAV
jgi:Mrp family chromosome partitioning ATPase